MNGQKTLQTIAHKSLRSLKYHSPTILSCLAIVGIVSTAVMTVRATPKAMQLLKDAENKKGEKLTNAETILTAAPAYIPSTIIGVSTIACVLGANVLNRKQQVSLISAYALLDESYKNYRKAANSVYGEDADSKIKAEMARSTYVSADGYALYDPDLENEEEKTLFYDPFSQRYFMSTIATVINAQYHINRNLTLRGYVTLNEFYSFLGIDKIDAGDNVGWMLDELMEAGIMWLDFENDYAEIDGDLECCIVNSAFEPTLLDWAMV